MRDANHPEDQKPPKKSSKKDSAQEKRALNEKWFKDVKAQFGELTKFYQIKEETSRGAYGVVYEGYVLNPETQEPTAKRVAIKAFFLYLYPQLVLTELNFLKLTKGAPHIVQLMDFMVTNQQFFIVTEFYKNQHFEKFMYFSNMMDIKYYMYSLLEGLATLHSLGIVHRDVKQGNFLYNLKKKKGLIIDFGLAEISREMKAKVTKKDQEIVNREVYEDLINLQSQLGENKIGTEGFMPLEQVLKKEEQSYEVDIWAAGTIFLEFLTAKHTIFKNLRLKKDKGSQEQVEYALSFVYELGCIFGSKKTKEMVKLCDFDVEFPSNIPEEQVPWKQIVKHAEYNDDCEDLLDRMLRLIPGERISAKEALSHPFFDDIRGL